MSGIINNKAMIQKFKKYKNITTGMVVETIDVFQSYTYAQLVVHYIRSIDSKAFLKPLYVFERTYKLLN